MYINKRRIIVLSTASVLLFLMGYHRTKLDEMFMNERTVIGLLLVAIGVAIGYVFYLKNEILRMRLSDSYKENYHEETKHENYKLRTENSNLKAKLKKKK